jgi:uncharacterized membrane-anchored protein YjiN (DUF445 family)
MTQVNVDFSSVIAAQFLEQLSEDDRNKLIQEALASVINGDKIREIIKDEALNIAKSEVQAQLQGDTEIRRKMVDIINGAFQQLLKDEEDLKSKLCQGFVQALIKDRY